MSQQLIQLILRQMNFNEESVIKSCCPFDKSHRIEPAKLAKHIQKCKSPIRDDFQQCRFNPSHWYLKLDIAKHEQKCSNNGNRVRSENMNFSQSHELSSISGKQEDDDNSELIEIQFELLKKNGGGKDEFSKDFNKKKINEQLRQFDENGLWKEPNFRQWFLKKQASQKKSKGQNFVLKGMNLHEGVPF